MQRETGKESPLARPILPGLGLALIALPFAEIALLVVAGQAIGALPTLGLLLAAGLAGVLLIRAAGTSPAAALRRAAATGRLAPSALPDLGHAALLAVAGVLLLVPGFLTDATGLLLALPPVRRLLLARIAARVATARFRTSPGVVEGEWTVQDPGPPDPVPPFPRRD